ncbi:SDR family oxidoreductase [bacterium]|nr:SDR family oxidoreductase [bacterium]
MINNIYKRILVTGANGFIGKNLITKLNELDNYDIITFNRKNKLKELNKIVSKSDLIIHLAGENRPKDISDFSKVNSLLTKELCKTIEKTGRNIPLIFSSSVQAKDDNPYGLSKKEAENTIISFHKKTRNPCVIYRLPGVFGKWCKPNYNSVVATFCYNIANGNSISISDPSKVISLVYIDDVINNFLNLVINSNFDSKLIQREITPIYSTNLTDLANQIHAFSNCRTNLITESVGAGFKRALYSTYLSYLPPENFSYSLPQHADSRGVFVEMLKTSNSGQFSFFTSRPGITRGSHYHHTKTEKFLVVKGKAKFGFRHIITNETYELFTSSEKPQVVETVPGWTHDIKNVGDEEMVAILWANEIFDPNVPDTIPCKVYNEKT